MAVTPATIAVALGRTAPEADTPTYNQWDMWIDDARMLIEAKLGDLNALEQIKLDYVVREAVRSHVLKPDDATSVAVAVDDGSETKTYSSSKGRVVIHPEWWDLLAPTKKRRAYTVDTLGGPTVGPRGHAPWCDLMFLGADCSCGTILAGTPIYEPEP